jgi:hypothetical protein
MEQAIKALEIRRKISQLNGAGRKLLCLEPSQVVEKAVLR